MIAALKIESISTWLGNTNVYELDEPLAGNTHLAVSVYGVEHGEWQNAGVEVIGCDETGWAPSLDVVFQSYEVLSHAEVLGVLGYTVLPEQGS